MNAEAEENERIDAEIAASDWCNQCHVPIGCGDCDGCIAVSASVDLDYEDDLDFEDDL